MASEWENSSGRLRAVQSIKQFTYGLKEWNQVDTFQEARLI